MWQDIADEFEKTAETAGNHFWPDVSGKEEGSMLRQLWTAALQENVLTAGQIETFLTHVLCMSVPTPCLKAAAQSECSDILKELSRELLFIDEKVTSICIQLFGRPLLPEHLRTSIAQDLEESDCSVDIFTQNSKPVVLAKAQ